MVLNLELESNRLHPKSLALLERFKSVGGSVDGTALATQSKGGGFDSRYVIIFYFCFLNFFFYNLGRGPFSRLVAKITNREKIRDFGKKNAKDYLT